MKIFFVSFGPIESKSNGYFIRTYHILNNISKKNFSYVLEFLENEKLYEKTINNVEYIKFLEKKNRLGKKFIKLLSFDPIHNIKIQLDSIIQIKKNIKLIKSCDWVFVESTMFPFVIIISKIIGKKVALDTNCLNIILSRSMKNKNFLAYVLRNFFTEIFEYINIKFSDVIITVSDYEKKIVKIKWNIDEKDIFVVPNLPLMKKVDINKKEINTLKNMLNLNGKKILMFVGDMNSIQNREAARYIIKHLAPMFFHNKNIVFMIVGKGKENFVSYPKNVIFTGFVEDIDSYIRMSDICLAPMDIGAGVKTKIIDYILRDKIIVATKKAMEGIEFKSDYIFVSKDLKDYPDLLSSALKIEKKQPRYSVLFIKREKEKFRKNIQKLLDRLV